jgi:hypothetical protein
MNFNHLGIKKLITTCYAGSPITGRQLPLFDLAGLRNAPAPKEPYRVEITDVPDLNRDGAIDMSDVECLLRNDANVLRRLDGDGDFRSPECIALLRQADVVVTNPPFSLFREYLSQLFESGKQFLILGDQNAITYADVFAKIMANKLWFGYENGGIKWFQVPDYYDITTESRKKVVDGVKYFSMGRIYWYTNLDTVKRHENLTLYRHYDPDDYPMYDNYDAIEVAKVAEIPVDYAGIMGVPITFLDKYNPEQFEILGLSGTDYPVTKKYGKKERVVNGERKKSNTGTLGCVIRTESFGTGTHFDVGYPVKGIYRRLFVRHKEQTS